MSLPLLHAVWTAIVGYFIGLSLSAPRKTPAPLVIGFLIAAALHGLYDAFQSAGSPLLALGVAAFSLLLFLSYRSTPPILTGAQRADRAQA
jgi:RsiW-degrading membrane proteinase PrsW (M82 family)